MAERNQEIQYIKLYYAFPELTRQFREELDDLKERFPQASSWVERDGRLEITFNVSDQTARDLLSQAFQLATLLYELNGDPVDSIAQDEIPIVSEEGFVIPLWRKKSEEASSFDLGSTFQSSSFHFEPIVKIHEKMLALRPEYKNNESVKNLHQNFDQNVDSFVKASRSSANRKIVIGIVLAVLGALAIAGGLALIASGVGALFGLGLMAAGGVTLFAAAPLLFFPGLSQRNNINRVVNETKSTFASLNSAEVLSDHPMEALLAAAPAPEPEDTASHSPSPISQPVLAPSKSTRAFLEYETIIRNIEGAKVQYEHPQRGGRNVREIHAFFKDYSEDLKFLKNSEKEEFKDLKQRAEQLLSWHQTLESQELKP